ncbi:MAG: branched-chain amino acid ABC transporter permease [Deferribacteres bacterium]|nr:branched-chain amino acid ABC transporter permease [Deferribacteres bacterium]
MENMEQLIVNGIITGSIIVLGAIGLTLTYGILRFANFAHGDLMTLGAYAALTLAGMNLPFGVVFVIAMAFTAAAGILLDTVLYRPLRKRGSIVLLISSIGAALLLRNLILIIWGPRMRYYSPDIQIAYMLPFGIRIKPDEILIIGIAAALIVLVHLFLKKTRIGKAMRATADNAELAQIAGINTDRVVMWTWGIGCALAAAAGILLGMEVQLRPQMGWDILLPLFAAAILGGIGRPYGAMAGGIIIGLSQEISTAFISTAYKPAVSFAVLILVLLIRPSGIFGKEGRWS